MLRKDERGYALSGLGLLLLIPVMIIIPIALSVQDQSADIPNTYVKSDTVFQTLKNIQTDINDKINTFKNTITKKTYNDPVNLATVIYALYNGTSKSLYQNTYMLNGSPGTVDSLNIVSASSDTLTMNNTTGVIPLQNGIEFDYSYVNKTTLNNNSLVYVYNMTINANMTMSLTKSNIGNNQNFYLSYAPVTFYLSDSTDTSAFFSSLKQSLLSYNICS